MASIRQRYGRWQVRISRKGYPTETGPFDDHEDAVKWTRILETGMDRGLFRFDLVNLKNNYAEYTVEVVSPPLPVQFVWKYSPRGLSTLSY